MERWDHYAMQSFHPPVEFSGERRTERKKYDGRKQPELRHGRNAYQTRRAGTLQKFRGVQEFQHRTVTHHRDVHDTHAPLHRPITAMMS